MIKKMHGVYYTPPAIAQAIVQYILSQPHPPLRILEPSCGDGCFVEALCNYIDGCEDNISLDVIDIDESVLQHVKSKYNDKYKQLSIYHCDFLEFGDGRSKAYDLIIGNPPYVKRNYLGKSQKDKCKKLNDIAYNHSYSVYNLWVAFLISCSLKLKDNGIIAFVLPKELLYVNFFNDLRPFLKNIFHKIELISLLNISFDDIEQDTIIFIGYRQHNERGVFYSEVYDETEIDLENQVLISSTDDILSIPKLSFLTLEAEYLTLLEKIGEPFHRISNYCSSSTGIVTGANSFFIVKDELIKEYKLRRYAKPIIQKGEYVKNHIYFTQDHFNELVEQGKNSFLLHFEKDYEDKIPPTVNKYLTIRRDELLKRYKIGNRTPWYRVPNVNKSECIFFKRSHEYPKLIYNSSGAYVTDIGYKVDVYDKFDILSFIFCFYNSYTLCMAELEGRSYAGGVLELTPREFKNLLLPYTKITNEQFNHFVELMESGNVDEALEFTDSVILVNTYNVRPQEIDFLKRTRNRLVLSRIKKGGNS